MNRTYKLIASRGTEIVFDGRIEAAGPRDARRRMKELLGLQSLSGIVYSITEVPVDLIRQIVDARIAEVMGGAEVNAAAPADLAAAVAAQLAPILRRLEALEQSGPAPAAQSTRFDPLASLPPPAPEPEPEEESLPEPEPPAGLNWAQIKAHLRRYRRPERTAELYGITRRQLEARAAAEGWQIGSRRTYASA
jgi:hypothetical protein